MIMSAFTGKYVSINYRNNEGFPGYTASFMLMEDGKKDHFAILEVFDNILQWAQDITVIDLSACGLGSRPATTALKLLKTIPASVHTINLSWNELSAMKHSELCLALYAIPSTVQGLNLSFNRLGDKNFDELQSILQSLNPNICIINLSNNNLDKLPNLLLAAALRGLSNGVTTVNLEKNGLDTKTPEELDIIFQYLPENVHTVYLDNKVYYPQQIRAAKRSIPEVPDIAVKRQRT